MSTQPHRGRAAAFAVWFYGVTLFFCLLGVPVRLLAPRRVLWVARAWARGVLAGMWPILGLRLVVTGRERLPKNGAALLASQHQSEFDTLVWMTLLPRPSYVMKQELTRLPLFGKLLVPAGMIPLDRAGGAPALRRLLQDTAAAAAAGRQIVIFPEGTRVPPGTIVKLQPGIAAMSMRLGLSVLPVATDSGRCWTRHVLARHGGVIHVAIGAPIPSGVARPEMLAAIESFWRRMENTGFGAVDNPVDQVRRNGGGPPAPPG